MFLESSVEEQVETRVLREGSGRFGKAREGNRRHGRKSYGLDGRSGVEGKRDFATLESLEVQPADWLDHAAPSDAVGLLIIKPRRREEQSKSGLKQLLKIIIIIIIIGGPGLDCIFFCCFLSISIRPSS